MERNVQKQKKLNEAITYIKRVFKHATYSEAAVRKKLFQKGFAEVEDEVIDMLKDVGLINDEKFARYIASNIAEFKGYGPNRIKRILVSKGYDEFLAENVVSELEIDFFEIARKDAELFMKKKKFKDEFDAKRKLYSHLLYKGFNAETIEETLREIKGGR
jgi:regulatory protein